MIKGNKFDILSYSSTKLELIFQNSTIATGSGILWRSNGKLFLVTNWHNFTGKNPFTNKSLSEGASVPDSVRFWITRRDVLGNISVHHKPVKLPLYEEFYEPFWKQHSDFHALRIDIAVIELNIPFPSEVITMQSNKFENLLSQISHDVFIVGYPLKNSDNKLPIWKRGSIASEPRIPWDGKPAYLIDAASRKGMSGSPVYRRNFGPAPIIQDDGSINVKLDNVVTTSFAGIYSGHLSEGEESVTLGIAWLPHLVQEIIDNPTSGTRD
ncbi:serine protease [Methylobacterium sp.]|uniref:S1 family peptidase n=1 Tax=Methylobacterium sp. TaxID=409 RepID=UPI0025D1F86E|nr:serine protease [Methylobacterium sp.]MBY0260129.1 serine protease [Methylobacterium sp.]